MPRCAHRALLALPLLILLAGGCGRAPAPAAQGGARPVDAFARDHGLEVESRSAGGRVELVGADGRRIALAPDLPLATIDGKAVPLRSAPVWQGATLLVPAELDALVGGNAAAEETKPKSGAVRGVVILDAGHGGHDSGAVANGLREKDIVLDVVMRAAKRLRAQGVTVRTTRSTDRFLALGQRSDIANRDPGAVFVSVHANSAGRGSSVRGIETFVLTNRISESYRVGKAVAQYDLGASAGGRKMSAGSETQAVSAMSRKGRADSLRLAGAVHRRILAATGEPDRKVQGKNLAVLRENYFGAAILTEIGFLTSRQTASRLASASYRERLGKAIADGVLDFMRSR